MIVHTLPHPMFLYTQNYSSLKPLRQCNILPEVFPDLSAESIISPSCYLPSLFLWLPAVASLISQIQLKAETIPLRCWGQYKEHSHTW